MSDEQPQPTDGKRFVVLTDTGRILASMSRDGKRLDLHNEDESRTVFACERGQWRLLQARIPKYERAEGE